MFILLVKIIFVLSAFGTILLILRQIPKLRQLPAAPAVILALQPLSKRILLLKNFRLLNYGLLLMNFLEKGLRRLRIVFLKIDNWVTYLINWAREKSKVLTVRSRAWMETKAFFRKAERKKIKTNEAVSMADIVKNKPKDEGVFKKQEEAYIRLLAKDPKNAGIYKNLSELYIEQKNYGDARAALEENLKLNPQDKDTQDKLKNLPPAVE